MPTAEIQRIALLVALGIAGYLLMLAWNEDYGRGTAPGTRVQAPTVVDAPGIADPQEAGVPRGATDPVPDALQSDIPDETLFGPERRTEGSSASGILSGAEGDIPSGAGLRRQDLSARLVEVTTPVFKLWIDRRGGDIVGVQLPKFPLSLDTPDVPFPLLDSGRGRTYIAQSGLIGDDGPDAGSERPLYEVARSSYDIPEGTGEVVLTYRNSDVRVEKRFVFEADDYYVRVEYDVENRGTETFSANLFAQLKRDGADPPGASRGGFNLGPQPYLGAALTTAESRYEKLDFDDLDEGPFRIEVVGGWMAILQHYFLSAWVAEPEDANRFYGRKRNDGTYIVGFTGPRFSVEPGRSASVGVGFYAGPKDQKRLEQIAPNLNLTVDYGFLWWLAVPLFYLLDWLQTYVVNWGVAIILLTLVVKLVLYPLSAASYKSMANMRRVSPQLKRIQERHAGDRQKLSQEMMGLYKKEKINPLGGCLPMLLQMPVFISLYWVLYESVELRQAPFFGWIHDLAAMDPFFVLPILMGASMFFQQQLNPPVPDPMQARVMKMMPIMFTVLFLFFPAGLVLYWLTNNLLSMAQQWYITRQIESAAAGSS